MGWIGADWGGLGQISKEFKDANVCVRTKLRVVDSMDMGSGLFMVHLEEIEIPTELMK